jgi:hypothetical protein
MARYVVLHFDDNEEAEQLVNLYPSLYQEGKVVALSPAPTKFCEDPFSQHGNKKAGYFRGKKYGWWVCSVCGLPTPAWGESYAAVLSSAVNLLNNEQPVPPEGWNQ